ncbi:MAG: S8 family serine peptidase [Elusimicrobia bacterium]|nr:S8 family serine peptidase [Elusimicrobiota bacterium]
MKTLQRLIAVALSALLVFFSPGLGCYTALAQTFSQGVPTVPGGVGALGVSGAAAVQPVQAGASVSGVRLDLNAGALPSVKVLTVQRGRAVSATPQTGRSVAAEIKTAIAAPVVNEPGFPGIKAEFRKESGKTRGTPDERPSTRDDGSPDRTDDSDDLGNPRRDDNRGGPDVQNIGNALVLDVPNQRRPDVRDDVWDGSEGRGGSDNDGLFSSVRNSKAITQLKSWLKARVGNSDDEVFSSRSGLLRAGLGKSRTPDERPSARDEGGPDRTDDLDDLGNPRRDDNRGGPDDVWDGSDSRGGSGNDGLFSSFIKSGATKLFSVMTPMLAAGALVTASFAAVTPLMMAGVYLAAIVPSLILHEMGHAFLSSRLGDPTAREQNRLSLRPRDLLSHINPFWTILLPVGMIIVSMAVLGAPLFIGGAQPVPVNPKNFRDPVLGMAKTALAGPAVNFALAAGFAAAYTAAAAFAAPALLPALALAAYFNVLLGVFNLLPTTFFAGPLLDGAHIGRAVASYLFGSEKAFQWFGRPGEPLSRSAVIGHSLLFLSFMTIFSDAFMWLVNGITGRLLFSGPSVEAVQQAAAALPGLAALGAFLRRLAEDDDVLPPGKAEEMPAPVSLIVRLDGASKPLPSDVHMSLVRGSRREINGAAKAYRAAQEGMLAELEEAGLAADLLNAYGATPVATYRRINAATLKMPADKAAGLRAELESRGFKVYENDRREIVKPVPVPQAARGALTMPETLKISTADKVHELARARWGAPEIEMGFFVRLTLSILRRLGLFDVPQPKVGVIDTGADTSHPLLKGIQTANATNGENVDDNGHGTWVTSMVRWYAPWLKTLTHYKTFEGGGATLDDILKALTMAGNDGNLVISNSWGSDAGDPESPDSQMVKKLAQEGRIMVFAAGNAGSRKNTVGSPAIMTYRDPLTGAPRVLAVAATDREGNMAYFSSRGKGSRITARDPKYKDWPQRPDLGEQGYNTEGAWPKNLGPGRIDPVLGPLSAISGTSMSTPKVAGTIALLAQIFGVTSVGEKLDAVVNAVMKTLANPKGLGQDDIGQGFNAVYAAFEELSKTMEPFAAKPVARLVLRLLGAAR